MSQFINRSFISPGLKTENLDLVSHKVDDYVRPFVSSLSIQDHCYLSGALRSPISIKPDHYVSFGMVLNALDIDTSIKEVMSINAYFNMSVDVQLDKKLTPLFIVGYMDGLPKIHNHPDNALSFYYILANPNIVHSPQSLFCSIDRSELLYDAITLPVDGYLYFGCMLFNKTNTPCKINKLRVTGHSRYTDDHYKTLIHMR